MNWKENNAEIAKIHRWIKGELGKALCCSNNHDHKGFFEWANVGHTYRYDINEWRQLCRRCHWELDHPKGRVGIKTKSWHNNQSMIISFRLPIKNIDQIVKLYNFTMPIGNCCRQIVLDLIATVRHHQ